jgi:4-hydroxy-2-oxoglutarate aldolase
VIRLEGILGPVVTPFDGGGSLDLAGFGANVRAHLAAGLHGIVVTGSTGEAALLDEAERSRLVDAARAEVPAGRPLIVGIGAESTRTTIARARDVAARGADAVLVVAPHYYGDAMTPEALRDHYQRVADASPVPVLLYTIPKYMHFALAPELVHELALHPNIVGMKDSSGDATLFRAYLGARSEGFQVLTGSGTLLGEALRAGADGAILAVALFAPVHSLLVMAAAREGDADVLAGAQRHLTPLAAKIVAGMGVAGVKAALDAVGLVGGTPRLPLRPLDAARLGQVRELLAAADVAPVDASPRS